MITQKEAIFKTIVNVLEENNIQFEEGTEVKKLLTENMKDNIVNILIKGFLGKEIELHSKLDESVIPKYSRGIMYNSLYRDMRLNGGKKYEPDDQYVKNTNNKSLNEVLKLLKVVKGTPFEKEVKNIADKMRKETKK